MKKILIVLGLLVVSSIAQAQTSRNPCYINSNGGCTPVATGAPMPVTLGGGLAGSISNAASGVATSATNVPVVSYNYVWNGATWDQASPLPVGVFGTPNASVLSVQGPITGGGFPNASTALSGNATGTTGTVVGTLAGAASKTTYICGFNVQAIGGTATVGPITIAGLVGSSQVYQTDVNSATVGKQVASANFNPCIPASAANTSITITTTANGTATAVDVNSWGYRQ